MQVIFYREFNKERESTKVPPPDTPEIIMKGTLKERTDIIAPTIKIELKQASPAFAYKYCYIPQFERYYFVNSYVYEPPFWEINLVCDVLASHRRYIGMTMAYVARSASEWDGTIVDTMYPANSDPVTYVDVPISNPPFTADAQKGTYVLGVINGEGTNGASVGAVTYYIMPASTMSAIKNMLLGNPVWLGVAPEELSTGLVKGLIDPFQYVVSCMWFPFDVNVSQYPAVRSFKMGWWEWPVSAINVISSNAEHIVQIDFKVRKHPQVDRGQYLNVAPYSSYSLYIPTFGNIALNPAWCDDTNVISCIIRTDLLSGQSVLGLILDGGLHPVMIYDGKIGVHIQLAQISQNTAGMISGVASAVTGGIGNLFSGNLGGAISSAATGISSALQSAIPRASTSGQNGCFAFFDVAPTITSQFYRVADEDLYRLGRPLCKTRFLNRLNGYVQCVKPEYPWNDVTDVERSQILGYMSSGMYLDWGESGGLG